MHVRRKQINFKCDLPRNSVKSRVYNLLKTSWIEAFQSRSDKKCAHRWEDKQDPGQLEEAEMFLSAAWTARRNAIEVQGTACWFGTSSPPPLLDILTTSPFGQSAAGLGHYARWNRGYGCRLWSQTSRPLIHSPELLPNRRKPRARLHWSLPRGLAHLRI